MRSALYQGYDRYLELDKKMKMVKNGRNNIILLFNYQRQEINISISRAVEYVMLPGSAGLSFRLNISSGKESILSFLMLALTLLCH